MRTEQVVPHGSWDASDEVGAIALDFDHRHRRRIVLPMEGEELLIDLPQAMRLRHGDGLLLDGGGVVRIVAAEEPLLEIHADAPSELTRIAWHLGNRHLPVQIIGDRIRIHADHVIADMIAGLGGHADALEAPFDPEPGAYASGHAQDEDDERTPADDR